MRLLRCHCFFLCRDLSACLAQGINVVMVALDDDLMKKSFAETKAKFPKVQFRSCGVNLGKKGELMTISLFELITEANT